MTNRAIRAWSWVHRWTSLVCTVFMLLLCATGLPLVFHHEIGHLLGTEVEVPALPAHTPRADLDEVMRVAVGRHPGLHGMYVSQEPDDDRVWYVTLGASPTAESGLKQVAVDARSAAALAEPQLESGFMATMRSLHIDLFAGQTGKLFLGFMGLLLVASLVSGTVLYAPFMRRLGFGEIRRERAPRVRWLDLHNLLGIVTLTWALVVGATGVVNTWADLVVGYWRSDQMAEMVAPYRHQPPLERPGSLQRAVAAARALEPHMTMGFIAFPGTAFSSPHHYAVFLRGTTPLTSRTFKPVLVDAANGTVTDSRALPWYLTALLVSQPLHFGDYGGAPMQWLWAGLDVVTIVVLVSGLYLWWQRRGSELRARPLAARRVGEEGLT